MVWGIRPHRVAGHSSAVRDRRSGHYSASSSDGSPSSSVEVPSLASQFDKLVDRVLVTSLCLLLQLDWIGTVRCGLR
jgi:hypothetical protein